MYIILTFALTKGERMLKNLLRKRSEKGFTIIEVMIVLAIAGLILVVVLVAVPQLQRNQRNSARRNDASRVATAVSNWVSNNNGAVFTSGTGNVNETAVINDLGNVSQYVLTTATLDVATGTQGALNNLTNIRVVTGAQCGANGASTATGAAPRQFVVQYATENSTGTPQGQCIEV